MRSNAKDVVHIGIIQYRWPLDKFSSGSHPNPPIHPFSISSQSGNFLGVL